MLLGCQKQGISKGKNEKPNFSQEASQNVH